MQKYFKEGQHAAEFILSEANGQRSREGVIVGESQKVEAGTILALLAQVGGVTVVAKAVAGNTGDGTATMSDPAVNSKAKNGTYRATASSDTSFAVEDPNGVNIGNATVGTAFNKEIKFTIAAGGTPFAAGDVIEIVVGVETPGGYHAVAYDPEGDDGSEVAKAIAIYPTTTAAGEIAEIAAIFRDAEVNGKRLAWPEGISAEDKAAATEALAVAGIIIR